MTKESRWNCPHCKCKRDAVKNLDIWRLPPILLVHLKRSVLTGGRSRELLTMKHRACGQFVIIVGCLVVYLPHSPAVEISDHHPRLISNHVDGQIKTVHGEVCRSLGRYNIKLYSQNLDVLMLLPD